MKKRPLKKSTLIVIATVVALALVVATLATLNGRDQLRAGVGIKDGSFRLLSSNETTMVTLARLQKLPARTVTVTLDTSTTTARQVSYTGLPLRELFTGLGVPFTRDNYCVARGSDGFTTSYLADEVERDDIWLVYAQDGKALPGRSQNGFGPFLIVTRGEQFSQRWCKYLQTLTVK